MQANPSMINQCNTWLNPCKTRAIILQFGMPNRSMAKAWLSHTLPFRMQGKWRFLPSLPHLSLKTSLVRVQQIDVSWPMIDSCRGTHIFIEFLERRLSSFRNPRSTRALRRNRTFARPASCGTATNTRPVSGNPLKSKPRQ